MKKLKQREPHHAGCLCCQGAEKLLPLETVLYQGFGGWTITKDGELFFMDDTNKEWEDFKTLEWIEVQAKKFASCDWRAILDTPLLCEVYQRQRGKWVLVEQNLGFA
jgi:hypothetical protein